MLNKRIIDAVAFEKSFIERLQSGDAEAFSALFDQYHRLLYALAYRYLKSCEEAEDAVQYTFMKIWEQRDSLIFSDGIRSLLFTVMKHYILNELRHRQVVLEKHEDISREEQEHEECFLSALEEQDMKMHLRQAIASLPPQKREVCKLKIEHGLTNQQIAERMNISIPTIKSHYTQAIKTLRKTLGKLAMSFLFSL